MTSVVGHVLVHQSPEPLDRVQMRAVDRHEMAPDPPAWHGQPVLNRPGVMVAGIVQEHMDDPPRRILDRDQEGDRAQGVDRHHLDHAGPAGFQIEGAVNVQAISAWSTATVTSLGAQQPTAPWVGCTASANITASSSGSVFSSVS